MNRPLVPLSQFVLKVHSRCDLACDHCYVYESADQSWRGRPMVISDQVISRTAQRIAEHARTHGLPTVQVVLHGGEPLLAGLAKLRRVTTELRSALAGISRLDLRIHTNGVLLDEEFCEFFAEQDVRIGISIDGDRAANDRHRRYADGRSSYDKVIRAIELLRTSRFRDLYGGLLCTIDVTNDPVAVYESLLALDPPQIDFLLPHATWDHPPARHAAADAEYGDWLIAIYNRWLASRRPVRIRTFESVSSTLNGGESLTEALGLAPVGLVVIETDGTYEQVDSLKAAFHGAPVTGFDVIHHDLDLVAQHPGIVARQQGLAGLCQTCRDCPVVTSCGGGLYAHRYRTGSRFANPSVYCPDLLKLITHIDAHQPEEPARAEGATTHELSGGDFQALAAGFGGEAAIAQLIGAQRTLRQALLGAVYQEATQSPTVPAGVKAGVRDAWESMATMDRQQPEAVDAVLGHPYIRVWAVRCLEQLRASAPGNGSQAGDGRGLAADLGHLGAIAAAAAIRGKTAAAVRIPVLDAAVHLPTLGRLGIGPDGSPPGGEPATAAVDVTAQTVTVRVRDGCWSIATADLLADGPGSAAITGAGGPAEWQPVRMLRAPGLCVALDDTDPYRDCHQWQAAPRRTDAEFTRWQEQFIAAWDEIERDHASYAAAMAAGLTTLMPLVPAQAGREASATARHAFGAVAAALPDDPVTLALLLIHEFQHVKLGAVLDIYDLYDPADARLFHAPWREDPRPLEGLLQGTYAHLAVTDFWRVRRTVTSGPAAEAAGQRFAYWRAHTCDAIETLASSGSLTPLGIRFVNEMRHSADA